MFGRRGAVLQEVLADDAVDPGAGKGNDSDFGGGAALGDGEHVAGVGIVGGGHRLVEHGLRGEFPTFAVIFVEAAFDGDGFFGQLGKAQSGFGIRCARAPRGKDGQIREKTRILQDV